MLDPTPSFIGRYRLERLLGKGGMGEVWLAQDPLCQRSVAVKRIRPELQKHTRLHARFHHEAKITASLTHPGIISIYELSEDYYVMPYVEGKTLKAKIYQDKASISTLLPLFMSVCQTVAYTHSKGILHRDLKPENIIVGTFGEVIVLDWGLAKMMGSSDEDLEEDVQTDPQLTRPGKVVGTVAYMAPERISGAQTSIQTDLYALGVILYQILTLRPPFERPPMKEFIAHPKPRYIQAHEPEELAPYRDISPLLSRIVMKMLEPDPSCRYSSVDAVMADLNIHLEGKASWVESAKLSIHHKADWQFQEHVLISKHLALTGRIEDSDWVNVMISKAGFSDTLRLKTTITIHEEGAGIGFLLNIPEPDDRSSPFEGYCLWLTADEHMACQLFRNTVHVMTLPDLFLKKGQPHDIILEKTGRRMTLILDGKLRMNFISYLPLPGTHVGLLSKDANFEIDKLSIESGNQNLKVSCLAIPDAFLAHKYYKEALAEYRRIAESFSGYAEGQEGLFRAGITLLEEAKACKDPFKQEGLYSETLEAFSALYGTPSAPYEYLGKALTYQQLKDYSEEIKCLELGLRRYARHPLSDGLKDQLIYRMHEASEQDRTCAYQLMLIVLRLLPSQLKKEDNQRLFVHLLRHWEPLLFLESPLNPTFSEGPIDTYRFAIPLAFWLSAPYILLELYEKTQPLDETAAEDALFCMIQLGAVDLVKPYLDKDTTGYLKLCVQAREHQIKEACQAVKEAIGATWNFRALRMILDLMERALIEQEVEWVHFLAFFIQKYPISKEDQIVIDAYRVWAYLSVDDWESAGKIFELYPLELLNQESTLLHPLFGIYLLSTEGADIADIHFNGVIETPYPRSFALMGHEIAYGLSEGSDWYHRTFMWERRRLYQLLTLYYHVLGDEAQESLYRQLEKEQYISGH